MDFISKWPSFTPEALKVIVQRQSKYHEDIRKILKELQNMETLFRSTEIMRIDIEKRLLKDVERLNSLVQTQPSGNSGEMIACGVIRKGAFMER